MGNKKVSADKIAKFGGVMAALRALKKERGLSDREIAEVVGVHGSSVSFWRTGVGLPKKEHWPKLKEAFGLDIAELVATGRPPKVPGTALATIVTAKPPARATVGNGAKPVLSIATYGEGRTHLQVDLWLPATLASSIYTMLLQYREVSNAKD